MSPVQKNEPRRKKMTPVQKNEPRRKKIFS